MKTLAEIEAALSAEYNKGNFHAPIKDMQGFDYIAWDESNRLANRVFGYMGWSSSVLSCDFVECDIPGKDGQPLHFMGFRSIVRITVKVWDEEHNMVVEAHHDGVGYGDVKAMGRKDPMDTACKAAKSDGLSTAFKHFGDYFGLFLYKKDDQANSGGYSGGSSYTSNQAQNGGDLGKRPSEAQARGLKMIGLTDEQIASLPFKVWKEMLDLFWHEDPAQKLSAQRILEKYGITATPATTADRKFPWQSKAS